MSPQRVKILLIQHIGRLNENWVKTDSLVSFSMNKKLSRMLINNNIAGRQLIDLWIILETPEVLYVSPVIVQPREENEFLESFRQLTHEFLPFFATLRQRNDGRCFTMNRKVSNSRGIDPILYSAGSQNFTIQVRTYRVFSKSWRKRT